MDNVKEQLETAIASLKCLRAYYEAENQVYKYDPASRLPHPGDMMNHIHRALDPLHRALRNVNLEATRHA